MQEDRNKKESNQVGEPKSGIKRIGDKVREFFKDAKKRKWVYVLSGLVLGLLIVAMCTLFYSIGKKDGREQTHTTASAKKDKKDSNKNLKKETVPVTKEAVVSEAAVTPESIVSESSGESVNAEHSGAVSDQQNATQNSVNQGNQSSSGFVAGQSTSATGGASSYAGKLAVVGNQLCTVQGTPIQLRGVSTHGLSWFPEYVNSAMFGELKAWGANTVRLAMYTAEYNGYCTGDGNNRNQLKELVKKGVQYATEQDLYVIIDWHILSDGNPNTHKSEAISFFAEMAELYKDNDHVLYEICNEPNGGVGWGEIKSYANEVIAVIRERDPDGVILVGTPTWSQEVDKAAADPITGYQNIMYTLHFYANTHRDSLRNTLSSAVEGGLPVFVSEFGICDASGNGGINTQQADLWIQTLNKYGISYVAWNLSNKAESSSLIQSGCSKTSGFAESELSESGRWLLRTLQGTTTSVETSGATQEGNQPPQPTQSVQENPEVKVEQPSQVEGGWQPPVQKTPEQFTPQLGSGIEAVAVNSWQEGNAFHIQYEIKVNNTTGGEQNGWNGTLTFPANAQVISGWNANFSASGNVVNFTAMDYNKIIQPGGKIEGIGCIIRFE